MLPSEPFMALAIVVVLVAAWSDLKHRRIPNKLTLPAIAVGLVLAVVLEGMDGLKWSGIGFAFGFGVFLLPWLMGGMGGGDVKLMAAVGALLGWPMVLWVTLLSCVVAILICFVKAIWQGKVLALLFSTWRIVVYGFRGLLMRSPIEEIGEGTKDIAIGYVPFGVSIAIGTGWAILLRLVAEQWLTFG